MEANAAIVATIAAAAAADAPVVCTSYRLMNGHAVFSECNLKAASVHVRQNTQTKQNVRYSVTIALVDIERNQNVVLQIIK